MPTNPTRTPLGVCTHTTFLSTNYGNHDAVFDCLQQLGVKEIRDKLDPDSSQKQVDFFRRCKAAGIKVNVTVGESDRDIDRAQTLEALKTVADCTHQWAGFNEPEAQGIVDWQAKTVDHQKWLKSIRDGNSEFSHIKLAGPPLQMKNATASMLSTLYSKIGDAAEYVNMHVYPGNVEPVAVLDEKIALMKSIGKPLLISEGGYTTETVTPPMRKVTDEAHQAEWLPKYLRAARRRGVISLYFYELLDDALDPDLHDHTAHFGLFHHDYSPKLVVANLAAIA